MQRAKKSLQKLWPQGFIVGVAALLLLCFLCWPTHSTTKEAVSKAGVVAATPLPAPDLLAIAPRPNCEAVKCLALTFDDGPNSQITPRILDILKQHNAKATFFVLGSHVGGNEELLHRIHAEGHEIGNHSWNHPHFTRISTEQAEQEVQSTQAAIIKAGVPAPHLFRPPYGDINEAVTAHIPLSVVRWDIDPEDWHPGRRHLLLEHMAAHARPGGVVVMHDTETTTADILDALLMQLQAQHFTLVTVSDALSLSPGQRGVYFSR